jgi:hypothetical protein
MMVVMSVMEVQKTHLDFRVASTLSEVNPRPWRIDLLEKSYGLPAGHPARVAITS